MNKSELSRYNLVLANKRKKVKIKKGDEVKVVAGNDKGKIGQVLEVIKSDNIYLIVKGINMVRKLMRNNMGNTYQTQEVKIHVSNVKKIEKL